MLSMLAWKRTENWPEIRYRWIWGIRDDGLGCDRDEGGEYFCKGARLCLANNTDLYQFSCRFACFYT